MGRELWAGIGRERWSWSGVTLSRRGWGWDSAPASQSSQGWGPTDGHLSCIKYFAITNYTAVKFFCIYFTFVGLYLQGKIS